MIKKVILFFFQHKNPLFDAHGVYKRSVDNSLTFQDVEETGERNNMEETNERNKIGKTDERSKTEETEETSSLSETSDDLSTDNKRIVDDNNDISAKVGEEAFTTHDSKFIRFSLQGFEEHFKEKVKKTLEFLKFFYKDWVKDPSK